ncbi:MAG: bL35 family ribosomal protein [Planctomycetota bacterium]|jgi:large subunit ribosomal protein L35|nr:50S ribosomal protein L35 [Planctomycetota bacterium]MDP6520860.1 bL35 family ribosomal protein [Planctomycetota bacterium]MDP6838944.1 bL35 family ribosomal protein [Planctomycetota bacterium]MDP6955478.1 bL35 family ribosomal protein [Planctomycetota bacterium]HJO27129.1 bL35 family ribosomal protein [Planctomycetota bacterium]
MPKLKSKSAVTKRYRVTKKGKLKCDRPARGHMHASKNAKQKRELRRRIVTDGAWAKLLRRMMGA